MIPAIILGIISLVTIEKSGGRKTGRGFAIGGIVVPVVAVPVLLMIILMPALNRVKKQARSVGCMAMLKQWGLIFSMYTDDNNGYFFSGEGRGNGHWWLDLFQRFYGDRGYTFHCPTATIPYTEGGQNPFGAWEIDDISGSYAPNGWICNPEQGKTELWGRGPAENYWRTISRRINGRRAISRKVQGANNIPIFLDAMWFEAWPRQADKPPPDEDWPKDKVNQNEMSANENEMRRFCINRHEGYVNGLFMDYSVRKVGLKELWTLRWHRQFDTSGPWTRAGRVQPNDWPQWMRNFRDY
jgi:hypothetical protein